MSSATTDERLTFAYTALLAISERLNAEEPSEELAESMGVQAREACAEIERMDALAVRSVGGDK